MEIQWRDKAIQELQAIYDYIYEQSPQNAERVINTLLDTGNSLGDFPYKFRKEPTINQNNIRYVSKWSYKIIYRIEKGVIIIVRVFDSRQNPTKLKER